MGKGGQQNGDSKSVKPAVPKMPKAQRALRTNL